MSGESSGASSDYTPSLLMPTMASTSSTPSTPSSTSEPPSVTITTPPAMSTTSYDMLSASPVSTTSVTSDSSPPSMSGSSTDATTPGSSTDASSYLSSLYPGTSSFPPQTSTTVEQAQTTSTVPSPLPTTGGGALATSTQISSSGNSQVFFNDRGAVTGTFVVVAIVFTATFAFLCYAWRRRLRRRNRNRNQMFNTITWPGDDQRLQAEPDDQPTTSMPSDDTSKPNSDALLHSIRAEGMETAGISAPATRSTTNKIGPSYEGLFFAKDHISRGLTGRAITTNLRPDSPVPSLTPSTPSMYPPSLPPMEIESNVTGSMVHSTPFSLPSTSPPPRPPRRRPPPPSSWKLTETAATPSSLTTSVSFTTLVPPSSPYTLDSISPSSIPDQSRTDSQLCRSNTAALVLDHPTRADVRSDRKNTSF